MQKKSPAIIFLDAATVDYGDLPLLRFKNLGNFRPYGFTSSKNIYERLEAADIVITNKCRIPGDVISRLTRLRSIHVAATGVNNVDLKAAKAKGIAVTNVRGYSTDSVAQFTFAFILALANNLVKYNAAVARGEWSKSKFFMLPTFPVSEVSGKTLGIVGYGAIGKRVAALGRAFGMKVIVSRIPGRRYQSREKKIRLPLNEVLKRSDYLTIHAPLTPLTENLINKNAIARMKKGACLLNLARGGIVDETALCAALKSGRLAGAASDVLSAEPPPASHILLKAPNILLTPHMAWASIEARQRLVSEIYLNIQAFLKGKKRNRIV